MPCLLKHDAYLYRKLILLHDRLAFVFVSGDGEHVGEIGCGVSDHSRPPAAVFLGRNRAKFLIQESGNLSAIRTLAERRF